jgi:hypothetical protein
MRSVLFASFVLATAACGAELGAPLPDGAPSQGGEGVVPGAFRPSAGFFGPIRVTPLDHDGDPVRCVTDEETRPCDIEVTRRREVYYRWASPAIAGRIEPGWTLRHEANGAVFALEPDGTLSGNGLYHPGSRFAQVLFCRLTDEPALVCRHEIRDEDRERVWNVDTCRESFVVRASGGELRATLDRFPAEPPALTGRVDPPATSRDAQALALFLLAAQLVDYDTDHHTPYVDDPQVGD